LLSIPAKEADAFDGFFRFFRDTLRLPLSYNPTPMPYSQSSLKSPPTHALRKKAETLAHACVQSVAVRPPAKSTSLV